MTRTEIERLLTVTGTDAASIDQIQDWIVEDLLAAITEGEQYYGYAPHYYGDRVEISECRYNPKYDASPFHAPFLPAKKLTECHIWLKIRQQEHARALEAARAELKAGKLYRRDGGRFVKI